MKPKILLVAGARPNFMKISPIIRAVKSDKTFNPILVHTGQHYDHAMSASFFKDLGIPAPNYNLEVGSGSHAEQTANIMIKFEKVCLKEKPAYVLVVGDVNSTIAAGLAAKKLNIKLVHVEAGLRSGDRTMPEEINRLATDAISDLFFTTEPEGSQNLLSEGHPKKKVQFVGHVMIDNLVFQLKKLDKGGVPSIAQSIKGQLPSKYMCLTLHRPSNVDHKKNLQNIMGALKKISKEGPILFPCHPRTLKNIKKFGLESSLKKWDPKLKELKGGIYLLDPLGYNEFLSLWKGCTLFLTDSGGLQEETTALKIPCITLRENTERPITETVGSNQLAGVNPKKIILLANKALNGKWKQSKIPKYWDGKASERIVKVLKKAMN